MDSRTESRQLNVGHACETHQLRERVQPREHREGLPVENASQPGGQTELAAAAQLQEGLEVAPNVLPRGSFLREQRVGWGIRP